MLAALDTLPPDQRAALVLVDMEGYSVDETARILDCAPGTVKSRCSRGRAKLLPLLLSHAPSRPGRTDEPGRTGDRVPGGGNPAAGLRVGPPDERPGPERRPPPRHGASDSAGTTGATERHRGHRATTEDTERPHDQDTERPPDARR